MNEYIAEISNLFSFDELSKRSWLELLLILSPSVLLILLIWGYSFYLKTKAWQWTIYVASILLIVAYVPYELTRQSNEMSRAEANIDDLYGNLQKFLHEAHLEHVTSLNNPEVAANMLDELINGLDTHEKQELILISWLMAENEKQTLGKIDSKQKVFAEEIKTTVSTAKSEIIDSRTPAEKISGDVVKKLETDVNQMIETKMSAFKLEIDNTLDSFENDINAFIQVELNNYEEKLATITEKNFEELKDYSSKARHIIAQQVNKINQQSLQKLDDTKDSIDGIGEAIGNINLQAVIKQIAQLSGALDSAQKKNELIFNYNECMRTAGMLDLGGKKDECKGELDKALADL